MVKEHIKQVARHCISEAVQEHPAYYWTLIGNCMFFVKPLCLWGSDTLEWPWRIKLLESQYLKWRYKLWAINRLCHQSMLLHYWMSACWCHHRLTVQQLTNSWHSLAHEHDAFIIHIAKCNKIASTGQYSTISWLTRNTFGVTMVAPMSTVLSTDDTNPSMDPSPIHHII